MNDSKGVLDYIRGSASAQVVTGMAMTMATLTDGNVWFGRW